MITFVNTYGKDLRFDFNMEYDGNFFPYFIDEKAPGDNTNRVKMLFEFNKTLANGESFTIDFVRESGYF